MILLALVLTAGVLRSEPALRWGADANSNAPYAFYNPGNKLAGFEYEIIEAVARRLGREAEFVQNDWDGLIPGLDRGLYDCVICGIEITPDKAGEVLFSDPYYVTYEQFVSRRGTPPVTSLDRLRGEQIGTLNQTAALRMLENTPGVLTEKYPQEINAYQDVVKAASLGSCSIFPLRSITPHLNPSSNSAALPSARSFMGSP